MENPRSHKLKSRHSGLSRLFLRLRLNLFSNRKLLKEDLRRTGLGLMTAAIISSVLDHGKFFDHGTVLFGSSLLFVGLLLWVIGHYGNDPK